MFNHLWNVIFEYHRNELNLRHRTYRPTELLGVFRTIHCAGKEVDRSRHAQVLEKLLVCARHITLVTVSELSCQLMQHICYARKFYDGCRCNIVVGKRTSSFNNERVSKDV